MRNVIVLLQMLWCCAAFGQHPIQLSPPHAVVDSFFFKDVATVSLELDFPGTALRYTLDGTPVTSESPLYTGPISISETGTIRTAAFHKGFSNSPEVELAVRSLKYAQSIKVESASPEPAPRYSGDGLSVLTNAQKGKLNFAASPRAWLGWEVDTLWFTLQHLPQEKVNQLTLSTLNNAGSWILPPAEVRVYHSGKLIGSYSGDAPERGAPVRFEFLEVPINSGAYEELNVLILSRTLPDWHDGGGRPAWIFLDELLLTQMP
ncbi:MAG: chitobiase/beta-hexosaminidase C-terminal domain-containing protein [Phaeodactylibacter sp.]|nr:chitobiase/beta-hexosaminidase C-terminal domain-containing protein [Phaeodactylibacter sp.]